MAEGVLRKVFGESIEVESAGLLAVPGASAVPYAIQVCARNGIDISRHRARYLDEAILRQASLALVMEQSQLSDMSRAYPWSTGRVHRLGRFMDTDFADLLGLPEDRFAEFFNLASEAVATWTAAIRSI